MITNRSQEILNSLNQCRTVFKKQKKKKQTKQTNKMFNQVIKVKFEIKYEIDLESMTHCLGVDVYDMVYTFQMLVSID